MAIFGTTTKKTETKTKRLVHARQAKLTEGMEHEIIRAPWLSEKALIATSNGIYTFEIPRTATKADVAGAIKAIYKVDARQIRIVNLPAKRKPMRARRGMGKRSRRHKAYVYLNAGDTIQFA